MKNRILVTALFGIAAAGTASAYSDAKPQSKSEAAAVQEAIRFERAKDAADQRQLRIESSFHRQTNGSSDRSAESEVRAEPLPGRRVTDPGPSSDRQARAAKMQGSVADAVRFERAKDAAAAKQARLDAQQQSGEYPSVAKVKSTKR